MRSITLLLTGLVLAGLTKAQGESSVSQWTTIFAGIEQATGTNDAGANGPLSVNALRIDLWDTNVTLVITPPLTNNYVPDQRETYLQTTREFLVAHQLQVAVNSGYFSPGDYYQTSGTPASVEGTVISQGRLVSRQTITNNSMSAMTFGSTNQAAFYFLNWPALNTNGVYNAIAGMYPLVRDGTNFAHFYDNALSDSTHQPQPRTAFGLTRDKRYLILMTIDGRQAFSAGAFDYESAEFLLLFGAWSGMNMDGGGSTCMVKQGEFGDPEDINVNSFQWAVGQPGSQRSIGCNFGVRSTSPASPILDLEVIPGSTTAIITWRTDVPASTQVEYGPTKSLGSVTPLDSRLTKEHIATLPNLEPGSDYYFGAISDTGSTIYRRSDRFSTTNTASYTLLFDVTKTWRYTTNNLDGINWTARNYDDSGWLGPGPGLLYIEDNPAVTPRLTPLPTPLMRTYYFRTHFAFQGNAAGLSLVFSNYVDDGAVFYLNGSEVYRLRMPAPPIVIVNSMAALAPPCNGGGDAVPGCDDQFVLNGNLLVQGDNLFAVEVHNRNTGPDIVFGSALLLDSPSAELPELFMRSSGQDATFYWNGSGFMLQQTTALSEQAQWTDVTGGATSPVVLTTSGTAFYRLRK